MTLAPGSNQRVPVGLGAWEPVGKFPRFCGPVLRDLNSRNTQPGHRCSQTPSIPVMKLRLVLLILAVCIAVGVWKSADKSQHTGAAPAIVDQGPSPALRGPAELSEPGPVVELEGSPGEARATTRREVETLTPPPAPIATPGIEPPVADGPQLEIRVIRKADSAPVAGIPVFVLEIDEQVPPPKEWLEVLQTEGFGPMVERFGVTRQTDANGSCQVPLPQGSLFARASGLGLVGANQREQELSNPLILEVEPVSGHRIFVHGPSGEPMAGVRVGIAPLENNQDSDEPLFLMAAAETAGSPPSALLSPPLEMKQRFNRMKTAVLALGLFANPVSAELSDPMGAGEEVHLQLPACGSVILKLSDQAVKQGGSRTYELASVGGSSYRLPIALENGIGRSDWVQLGLRIEVSSTELSAGGFTRQQLGSFDGPTQANPVVEFIVEPPPVTVISGTALNPKGEPLAKHQLELSVNRSGPGQAAFGQVLSVSGSTAEGREMQQIEAEPLLPDVLDKVQTDAQGNFEVRAEWLPTLLNAGQAGHALGIHLAVRRHGTLVGEIDVPMETLASGGLHIELGELTFQGVPLLIAGRVLDRAGKPVSGSLSYTACDGADDPELKDLWQAEQLRVGRQGSFDIHQSSTKSQVRLEFLGEWHVTREPVFAPRGVTGFELIVSGAGGLVYEVMPPSTLPIESFIFNLETELVALGAQAPDPMLQRALNTRGQEGEGRYSLRGIPEGNYQLNVRLGDLALTEYNRNEVVIQSGKLTDLGPIDLTRGLTFLEVRFDPPPLEGEFPWVGLDSQEALDATLINWYDESYHWVLVGRNLPQSVRLRMEQGVVEGLVQGQTLLLPGPQ